MDSLRKFCLGTAQFGMNYGVSNTGGRVSSDNADEIVRFAFEHGMRELDTAINYGISEEVLGNVGVSDWNVISKLPAVPGNCPEPEKWINSQLKNSLGKLKVDKLYAVLLHEPHQLFSPFGEIILSTLKEAQDNGLISKIGVSVYSPSELGRIYDFAHFDIVQCPFNIFDQRLLSSGWGQQLRKTGVEVHVRSIFLQGLLLMSPASRPGYFSKWSTLWEQWHKWTETSGHTSLEACIAFALEKQEIDKIVVGVESIEQLSEIAQISMKSISFSTFPDIFSEIDSELIDPSKWQIT
jgi:aryl-alcohol dehydrogenase-like predicted oxidoreductase